MTKSNRLNSIAVLLVLWLAFFLWQGSSCRSSNTNSNASSTMNTNTSTAIQSRDLRGMWGGEHIAMEVTYAAATIEYDCAHGRINEKIAPDADGKFKAKGIHKREHGGPERDDEDEGQPAIYRGSIKDGTMTLTVELSKNNESVGTFTLTHGKTGRIRKCK